MADNFNPRERQRQAAAGEALNHVLLFRPLTISVETAAAIACIGRDRAYAQARVYVETDGETGIPTLRDGRYLRVLTLPFLALYGLDLEVDRGDES